nr:hypothetical protein [Tanacetum cinerariifolium]
MAAAANLDQIEEVNANCILMENLQEASTSGTQTDKAPVYDSNGSAEDQTNDLGATPYMLASTSSRGTCQPTYTRFTPLNGNGNLVAARAEGNATGHNANLDQIEEVNANCILMENLQEASTSGTQTDKAPVYDSNGSAE